MSDIPEKQPQYRFDWGYERKPVYKPEDLKDIDYEKDLGDPGEYPFVRGNHALLYRKKPMIQRVYSGFLSGEDTSERLKYLFDSGMRSLSIALDLPTQLGLDPDDPKAEDEVGRMGVSISTLKDMEDTLHGVDLSKVSTNITINALAPILLSMYVAAAEKQGVPKDKINLVTQNDILKEYVVRGAWIFPPRHGLRLTVDVIEYCARELPGCSPVNVAAGHLRASGASTSQELAWGLEIGLAYLQTALDRGLNVDQIAPFISYGFHNKLNFFEDAAKLRAARRIWSRIIKERYKSENPKSLICRIFAGGGMEELTVLEPLNNIIRETLVAIGAILGGAQSMGLSCYDEAYTIPSPEAHLIELRTMQILTEEAGIADVVDPLGGSYYIEKLTTELEQAALKLMHNIEQNGGIIKAIESGDIQGQCAAAAYARQKRIDNGDKVWIGQNRYVTSGAEYDVKLHEYDPMIRQKQVERLNKIKAERNNPKVQQCLAELRKAAENGTNILPATLEAVKAYSTIGEMTGVLREVFGEHKEPRIV